MLSRSSLWCSLFELLYCYVSSFAYEKGLFSGMVCVSLVLIGFVLGCVRAAVLGGSVVW